MKIIIFQLYGEALTYDVDVRGKIIPCGECKTTAVTIGHITGKEGEWSKSYYLILNKTNYNKMKPRSDCPRFFILYISHIVV